METHEPDVPAVNSQGLDMPASDSTTQDAPPPDATATTTTPLKREFSENTEPHGTNGVNDSISLDSQHSSKRARKESPTVGVAALAHSPQQQGATTEITREQFKYCVAMVRSLKKHRDAGPFLQPVDPIKLNIPDYPEIIKQPMDLSTVEKKLKSQQYPNVAQFKADLKLVFDNCYLYNGKDSPIGLMAQNLEKVFGNQIQNMPSREEPAHAAVTSTIAAAAATTPTGTTTTASAPAGSRVRNARKSLAGRSPYKEDESPERSESRQQRRVSATSPRPKRLHVGMPENQHKFCASVIKEFKKKSHANIAFPFLQPVDWVALNIPDYPQVIKNPMDISTIKRKLDAGEYQTSNIFEADVRLMFQNCYTYNPPQNPVHEAGRALEAVFDAKWVGLPPVPPSRASPASPAHREKTPQSASQTINHEDTNNHIEVGHDESPKSSQIKDLEKNLKEMHKQLEDLKRAESMKQVATVGGGVRSRSAVPGQPQSRTSPTPEGKRGKGRNRGRGSRSGNRSASKVATIEHNGAEEALTFEQKKALSSRIETLPAERLQVVLDIIKSAYPDINEDEEEIELDIEMLDKATLRRLYDYAVLGKDNAASSSYSAVGSQRVPEYLESDQSKRSQLEEKLRQLDSVKNSGSTPTGMFGTRTTQQHYGSSSSESGSSGSDDSGDRSD